MTWITLKQKLSDSTTLLVEGHKYNERPRYQAHVIDTASGRYLYSTEITVDIKGIVKKAKTFVTQSVGEKWLPVEIPKEALGG